MDDCESHQVIVSVLVRVEDAIDLKDASRIAAGAVREACQPLVDPGAEFVRGLNAWSVSVRAVMPLSQALLQAAITLVPEDRFDGEHVRAPEPLRMRYGHIRPGEMAG